MLFFPIYFSFLLSPFLLLSFPKSITIFVLISLLFLSLAFANVKINLFSSFPAQLFYLKSPIEWDGPDKYVEAEISDDEIHREGCERDDEIHRIRSERDDASRERER